MYWFDEQKLMKYAYYKTPKDIQKERDSSSWFQREFFLYEVFHPMILQDFEDGRRSKLSLDECRYLYGLAMDLIHNYAVDEERAWLAVYHQHWEIKRKLVSEELVKLGVNYFWKDGDLVIEQTASQIEKLGFHIRPRVFMRQFSMIEIQVTRDIRSNRFLIQDQNSDVISNEFLQKMQDLALSVREANGIMRRIDQRWKEEIKRLGLTPLP